MQPEIDTTLIGPADTILLVSVPQDLDHMAAEPLRARIEARLPEHDEAGVILDMSSVVLITSIGIAALLQIEDFARSRGVPLCLVAVGAEPMHFLEMLRLEARFPRRADIEQGIAFVESARTQ